MVCCRVRSACRALQSSEALRMRFRSIALQQRPDSCQSVEEGFEGFLVNDHSLHTPLQEYGTKIFVRF